LHINTPKTIGERQALGLGATARQGDWGVTP
jgi:hypothetical protein